MRAIVIKDKQLELRDVPMPEPGPGQARVRIHCSAVNRADLVQRAGFYPAPPDAPADIPGLEIAGEVDAIGAGVTDVAVGDRVYGLVGGGGYAEHVVVHARTLAKIPLVDGKELSFQHAAAIPEAYLTAYDAVVLQAGLAAGETLLVHAAGSGVGVAAIQIANAIGVAAIGTTRTKDKLAQIEALGARAILAEGPKFADAVRAIAPNGADVVLELVGGDYVAESVSALADRGRLVLVGLLAGASTTLNLGIVLRKRLRIMGTVLRARPIEEKIAAGRVLAKNLSPLVASRKLVPVIDRTFTLAEATQAMDHVGSNQSFGKVILRIA